MQVIEETEAQEVFDSLLDLVAAGKEFQITRFGKVVARLTCYDCGTKKKEIEIDET